MFRDAAPVGGATVSSYLVDAADIGSVLTWQVTAHNAGGASSPATSNATDVIPPVGGFAFLVGTSADGNDTSATTSAIDTTGADLLIAVLASFSGSGSPTISDSNGNSWNYLTLTIESPLRMRLAWCVPTVVGAGHTFTVTGGSSFPDISVAAFSGANATPADQENGNSTAAGTSLSTGSITPSENNELIITGLGVEATISSLSMSGYTIATQKLTSAFFFGTAIAYKIQTSASTENPSWAWTTTAYAVTRIASFKAA